MCVSGCLPAALGGAGLRGEAAGAGPASRGESGALPPGFAPLPLLLGKAPPSPLGPRRRAGLVRVGLSPCPAGPSPPRGAPFPGAIQVPREGLISCAMPGAEGRVCVPGAHRGGGRGGLRLYRGGRKRSPWKACDVKCAVKLLCNFGFVASSSFGMALVQGQW